MLEIRTSLLNLRTYIKEHNSDSLYTAIESYKSALCEKIQSIVQQMGQIRMEPELNGSFKTIYDELVVLRGKCEGELSITELPATVERICGLVQIHFHTTEFNDAEKEVLKNFPNIISIFREGKDKMALGEFGITAQSMVIENVDEAYLSIAPFAILNLMKKGNKDQIEQLKNEGKKMLDEDLINDFLQICDQLNCCDCSNLSPEVQALIYKNCSDERLDESEWDFFLENKSYHRIISLPQNITDFLLQSETTFDAIMKGASISQHMMEKELASVF